MDGASRFFYAFATTPGQLYLVSFFLSGPGVQFGFPDPRLVAVDVAGVQLTFSTPASSNLGMFWSKHEFVFPALAGTTTLTFSSPHDGIGFWGPVLDDVSVDPVPEPATFGMLLLGLVWVVRRHR